jgi:hypothetical protein
MPQDANAHEKLKRIINDIFDSHAIEDRGIEVPIAERSIKR